MHPAPHPADSDISAAARQWLARLHAHDCSVAERDAFQRWRDADPAHAAAYDAVHELWQRSAHVRHHDDAFAAALREARRMPPRTRGLRDWTPQLAAAAVVLAVVGLLAYLVLPTAPPPVHYATALGEQRTIALEDGSQLVLDTGTEVQVRYGRRQRDLTLNSGQAEFQVQRDSSRPFVVHAPGGTVTATGTRFQVRVEPALDTVTLLEGQVVVAAQPAQGESITATLTPGERIAIEPGGQLTARTTLPEDDLARLRGWTQGQLVVRDWPLENVVAELNRYSSIHLELADPSLRDLPISGRFKTGDPQTFARSLAYGLPIRVEHPAPNRIVLRHE